MLLQRLWAISKKVRLCPVSFSFMGVGEPPFPIGSGCGPSVVMPRLRWIFPGVVRQVQDSVMMVRKFLTLPTKESSGFGWKRPALITRTKRNSTVLVEQLMTTGLITRF